MKYNNKKPQGGVADAVVSLIEKGIDSLVGLFLQKPGFDVFKSGELNERWKVIEETEGNMAVIEADKLVDAVLKRASIAGESMADRLRKTEPLVERHIYQGMWDAHKLRNSAVHEVDRMVSRNDIDIALTKINKYLTALGAFKNE